MTWQGFSSYHRDLYFYEVAIIYIYIYQYAQKSIRLPIFDNHVFVLVT